MTASDFLGGEITKKHLANTGDDPEDNGGQAPDCAKKTKLTCIEKTQQYCGSRSKRICLAVPMTDPIGSAPKKPSAG